MRTWKSIVAVGILGLMVCAFGQALAEEPAGQKGKEKTMSVKLQWLGHASFKITDGNTVIYIDPWKLKEAAHDATLVLVSHSHYDHYSADDIAKVSAPATKLIASADVIQQEGKGQVMKPGQTIDAAGVKLTSIPAYNIAKKFHPRANNWLGFVIEIAGKRIYYAGDTDQTPEMNALKNIDLALLPVGGTYTMNAAEAAEATKQFKPKCAIPYHYGDIVGGQSDADNFAKKAACVVKVLKPGESTAID
ncbi:MAG: MBL fold metallo-hydrolase [Sedimentisphaerales bacterium]|nr:MBL fold metallo-hydrolase [Sedimentisphaerales bacterium]